MAWTQAARDKAAATRKATGATNHFAKAKLEGRTVEVSEETRTKLRAGWTGRKHTEETKQKISEKARASAHRRLLKSTRTYIMVDGTEVLLDSSWEEELAKRLDSLGIEWSRPTDPLKWIDSSGKSRNYFPDFYLPKYRIYLDPKNPAAFVQQAEKVQWLQEHREDIQFLTTLDACKVFRL